ncbi:MAG TPA: response regulator [Saprospiraceae bacterium]|nr:response regulator [Saprospiraceae bacterium]
MPNTPFQEAVVQESVQKEFQILLVEDDEDMRAYLASLLEPEYRLLFASNGKDALHQIGQNPINLVVSDISMPIMDGFELLKHLRQDQDNFVPFLFLTAHTEKSEVRQALILGVDGYITKPFESDELLVRVSNLLTNTRKRIESALLPNSSPVVEDSAPASFRTQWLKELEAIVHADIGNPSVKVPDLAFKMALSERTFRNRIKEYTGLSPNEYMMEARMSKALHLLENGTYLTVAEVAYAVGLEYSSYFTKNFKERFGKAPSEYL